ncbi:hypothetical protein HMN09_00235800 [Mycena chlorophos]|uniref:Uncharacterized protein n=1 Tax=Mycena chlorophos TaxID=658473 RepID=A0A8H6TJR5_MYCCL|nr:hypothetical protein HMN09_00235800 [Mycena chlorophos]
MPSVVLSSPVHGLPHSLSGYTPTYSRVSSFRSPQLEVLLYSPHVTTETTTWATNRTIPIYGDHDTVTGKIIIDPSCRSGRIYLTLTGTFSVRQKSMSDVASPPEHIRHIFFHAARTIEVADSDLASPSSLRSVFRRKSRTSTAEFETRTFPFAFDLGESHTGKILPSTFSSSGTTSMPVELAYQLVVAWEPARLTYKNLDNTNPHYHSTRSRLSFPRCLSWRQARIMA